MATKKALFTGAAKDTLGLFQSANSGTLFLDEIADLPLAMQVKLLRAIQEKKVRAIGNTVEETVDVRIISATHKNLNDMMTEGLFRQDLYYRLNVIQLNMPALREHREDIPELTDKLLEKLCGKQSISAPRISGNARRLMLKLPLLGNVRELENMLERALALCDGKTIIADDLLLNAKSEMTETTTTDFEPTKTRDVSLSDHLEWVEKRAILKALRKTSNNKTAAAKLLGVSFRTLRYRLSKLGIKQGHSNAANE